MRKKSKPSLFKKTLKTLPVLFGVMAVVYLGLLMRNIEFPAALPVTDVQVKGELNFLNKEEIKVLVMKNISGGYFTVDLNNIRELLLHEPWVKNVSLRRKWPASLNVFIEEQVPIAYWNNNALLSENGDVFKPETIDKELNLPALNGPEGQHDNVWKFMNILYKETAMLNYQVVRLNLDDRRAWQLVLAESTALEDARIEIKLGRFDTEKRLQRFVRILPALTIGHGIKKSNYKENKIKVIDMRYPNGFAVQTAENCSPGDSSCIALLASNHGHTHLPYCKRPLKMSEA
jgi:cell division protein FtsQ